MDVDIEKLISIIHSINIMFFLNFWSPMQKNKKITQQIQQGFMMKSLNKAWSEKNFTWLKDLHKIYNWFY